MQMKIKNDMKKKRQIDYWIYIMKYENTKTSLLALRISLR